MRSRDFHLALALLLGAASLFAQDRVLGSSKPGAMQRVAFAPVATVRVAAGKSATVELPFRVTRGYHINSHKPTSELLVPTVLSVKPPTDIAVAKLTYPDGEDRSFPFSPGDKLNVYTGDFAVTGLVRAARTTPPGRYRVKGILKYQACDDRACYPPGQLPVAFDVKITKAASTRPRRNPAQSPHVHQ
ncbi:MAG: protein-disulfide reductase DsbD domain-containing protein [Terriglobales bacterium]